MSTNCHLLDFIVIGASKSGTTSLFNYLRHHPRIYLPPEKDAPFFADDGWFEQGWAGFADQFFAQAPAEKLWGTVTPRYMEDLRTPERIFGLMPQAKLVAILRHPVDRTYSHYRQQVRRDKEARTFAAVVEPALATAEVAARARTPAGYAALSYCHPVRSEYGRILSHFSRFFPPPGQFLILFTDDLEERPQFVIDSVLTFIGLEPGFTPPQPGTAISRGWNPAAFSLAYPHRPKTTPVQMALASIAPPPPEDDFNLVFHAR